MWPALRAGDVAGFLRDVERVKAGDVVVARLSDVWVIHRVLAREGRTVRLRGDNCFVPDAPVPLSAVMGVVEQVRRRGDVLNRGAWDCGPSRLARVWVQTVRRLSWMRGQLLMREARGMS